MKFAELIRGSGAEKHYDWCKIDTAPEFWENCPSPELFAEPKGAFLRACHEAGVEGA